MTRSVSAIGWIGAPVILLRVRIVGGRHEHFAIGTRVRDGEGGRAG